MTKVCEFGEDTWSLGIHSTLPTCCGQIQPSKEAEEHQIWRRKKTGTWRSDSQVQSSLKKEWPFAVSAPATEEVGMGMASGWGDVVGDAGENDCKGAVGTKGWLKRAPPKKETIEHLPGLRTREELTGQDWELEGSYDVIEMFPALTSVGESLKSLRKASLREAKN